MRAKHTGVVNCKICSPLPSEIKSHNIYRFILQKKKRFALLLLYIAYMSTQGHRKTHTHSIRGVRGAKKRV